MTEKFKQLELDGVLSEKSTEKNVVEKPQTEKQGLENKRPLLKNTKHVSGFVKSLEKKSLDPEWKRKQDELNEEIKKRRGDLY